MRKFESNRAPHADIKYQGDVLTICRLQTGLWFLLSACLTLTQLG